MQINNPDIGGEEQNHDSYFPSTIKEQKVIQNKLFMPYSMI